MKHRGVRIEDPLALPLTRPPTLLGVQYEYFAINGILTIILFIATGALKSFFVALPLHFAGAYLCARDPHYFRIIETLAAHKRAVMNLRFWGARSYRP